jgi:hypothetical protein
MPWLVITHLLAVWLGAFGAAWILTMLSDGSNA